jgi:hypothetical protein
VADGERGGERLPRTYVRWTSLLNGVALVNLGLSEVNAPIALIPIGEDTLLSRWSAVWSLAVATAFVMIAPALGMLRFGMV